MTLSYNVVELKKKKVEKVVFFTELIVKGHVIILWKINFFLTYVAVMLSAISTEKQRYQL